MQEAMWNYWNNRVAAFNHSEDACMSYEKALQNLVVFLFAHYSEAFKCHGARQGHRAILALECLTVADTFKCKFESLLTLDHSNCWRNL